MATRTRAELGAVFECDPIDVSGGLDEFAPEPEAENGLSWQRVPTPSATDRMRWQPYAAPVPPRSWPIVVPVVIAAAVAGAALSWLGLRESALPSQPLVVAPRATPVPTEPAFPSETAIQPADIPSQAPSPPTVAPTPRMTPELEATLAAVSRAYRERDASRLLTVWPGADTADLEQAFSAVKYQALSFDRCTTRPTGPDAMTATCAVSIAAAAKEGDPSLQRHRESWTLVLNRAGTEWTIAGVSAQAVP